MGRPNTGRTASTLAVLGTSQALVSWQRSGGSSDGPLRLRTSPGGRFGTARRHRITYAITCRAILSRPPAGRHALMLSLVMTRGRPCAGRRALSLPSWAGACEGRDGRRPRERTLRQVAPDRPMPVRTGPDRKVAPSSVRTTTNARSGSVVVTVANSCGEAPITSYRHDRWQSGWQRAR